MSDSQRDSKANAPSILVAPSFLPTRGGIEILIYSIFSKLAESTAVVTFDAPGGADFDVVSPVHTVRISPRGECWAPYLDAGLFRIHPMFYYLRRLASPVHQVIAERKPELLYVSHLYAGLIALRFKRTYGLPYILFAHGNEFMPSRSSKTKILESRLIPAVLRNASAVIAISIYTADLVQRWVPEPLPITTIPLGPGLVDLETANCKHHRGDSTPILLSVSRLVSRKGHDTVLQAVSTLSQEFPNLRYVIVGDGPERSRLMGLAKTLGVDKRVDFVGEVDDTELARWYQNADIFVLPVRHDPGQREVEGFGIVFLEANAFGLPVVAGRSGGVPDAVIHGQTGLLVDPHNLEKFIAALRRLLMNPELRVQMGQAGRQRVLEKMNWDRAAQVVMQLQRQILGYGMSSEKGGQIAT